MFDKHFASQLGSFQVVSKLLLSDPPIVVLTTNYLLPYFLTNYRRCCYVKVQVSEVVNNGMHSGVRMSRPFSL